MIIDLAIDGQVFITNTVDAALQEIDLIFNTTNTELIGYPKFGTNFEYFLWQLTPSPNALEQYIYDKLVDTYFCSTMDLKVHVDVVNGSYRSIYYVKITVTDPHTGNTGNRTYELK